MDQFHKLVSRGMAVYNHEFSWVDAYVTCGCTTADDIPFSIVHDVRELGYFTRRRNKYNDMRRLIKLLERAIDRN